MQEETSVHSRIRELADASGLKNADLARIAGVSPVAVGKWFREKQTPKADQLLKLARRFAVSMEWLLTGAPAGEAPIPIRPREDQIEDAVARLKTLLPGEFDGPDERAQIIAFLKDLAENDDEEIAARGGRSGPPDILALVDLQEAAVNDLAKALFTYSIAASRVERSPTAAAKAKCDRAWENVVTEMKRALRRSQSLVAEVRSKFEPDPF